MYVFSRRDTECFFSISLLGWPVPFRETFYRAVFLSPDGAGVPVPSPLWAHFLQA